MKQCLFLCFAVSQFTFLTNSLYAVKALPDCVLTTFDQLADAIDSCDSIILDNIIVPGGQTLNLTLRDGAIVKFRGNTSFGHEQWPGPLVAINGTNVTISGEQGSFLDGRGPLYWDGRGEWGSLKPIFFIIQLHNSVMRNISVLNAPVHCVLLADSTDVELKNWSIDNSAADEGVAPANSFGHNTDGFDVWNSTNIVLQDMEVYNQDDCVAIRCGANILINKFYCHGGHGLSISVGFSKDCVTLNTLQNVTVSNSELVGGENGIHLKTHVDAGNGFMKNISFKNVLFSGPIYYGINIQQNYENLPANSSYPSEPKNNIPIIDLHMENIIGFVEDTAVPIYVLCADNGCFEWSFKDVFVSGNEKNNCNYEPAGFHC